MRQQHACLNLQPRLQLHLLLHMKLRLHLILNLNSILDSSHPLQVETTIIVTL